MTTSEGTFHASPDVRLYTKTWHTSSPPQAILAFVHGFSDHCNAYYSLFPTLADSAIEVHAFDQRGWGRSVPSPSHRGLTGSTSTVLSDISAFLASINKKDDAPLFLMGHSMGGAEALLHMLLPSATNRPRIRGYLAEAPYIALHPASQPHALTVYAGKLAAKLLPHRQMVQKLDPSLICRDPKVCMEWDKDELCHDTGTLEGLAGMLGRAAELDAMKDVDGREQSVWIGHGSADRVTSFEASKRFFEALRCEDKEFKVYEGAYHKLHAEPEGVGEAFARDVRDWVLARCGNDAGGGVSSAGENRKAKL